MLSLLLLWLGAARGDYFQSNAGCGFPGAEQQFVGFSSAPQVQPGSGKFASVGVCNWGVSAYSYTASDDFAGKCLQCQLVAAADARSACPAGWRVSEDDVWQLAPASGCAWSSGCLGLPCANNSVELQTASCGAGGGLARSCCPIVPHVLCCQVRQGRVQPAGRSEQRPAGTLPWWRGATTMRCPAKDVRAPAAQSTAAGPGV